MQSDDTPGSRRLQVSALERKNLQIDNLLALVTVPHFYAAFWGTNNVDMYKKIARVVIRSDPLRRKRYKERNVADYVAYEVFLTWACC